MPKFNSILFYLTSLITSMIYGQQPSDYVFWLNAATGIAKDSSNIVSNWTDASRNIKADQSNELFRPRYLEYGIADKPSIEFITSGNYLNMPPVFPTNSDYTIIIICKSNAASANILGGTSRTIWNGFTTAPRMLHEADFNNEVVSRIDPGLEPAIIIAQYRKQTQRGWFYVNGAFSDSSYCPVSTDPSIYISAYQGGYHYNGLISEILVYPRILTPIERITMEAHYKSKYKIVTTPSNDPNTVEAPQNHQLYPRNKSNEATVRIAALVDKPAYDSAIIICYRNGNPIDRQAAALVYNNNLSIYDFQKTIRAGLFSYSFRVFLKNKTIEELNLERKNIVCGDVYIINGQSNSIFGGINDTDPFCRTYGMNFSQSKADTLWSVASAAGYGGSNNVGAIGMYLAKKLIAKYQIPVCIMNGGVGGTAIEQHQRNDVIPTEPNNIYGSLLYRMTKCKLKNAAKALLWYQGESSKTELYQEYFDALYEDWEKDYPNLQKIYVMQIHHGCGTGDNSGVREVLRNLGKKYPKIIAMSTNGIPEHDGCHYTGKGYSKIAENLFPLIERDFFNGPNFDNIDAPNLRYAYYTNSSHNQINLVFAPGIQQMIIPQDTVINSLTISIKDYFALDDAFKKVAAITANNDIISLDLKSNSTARTITYLPEINYLDTATIYEGPYITNARGIGAFSFYKVPILDAKPTSVTDPNTNVAINAVPNPSSREHKIHLHIVSKVAYQNVYLELYELSGKLIYSESGKTIEVGKNFINIDVPQKAPNQILWKISNNEFKKSGKIILR